MNIIGKDVLHVKFGKGIICEKSDDRMEVDFGEFTKCFPYPGAFEVFFKTKDLELKGFIDKELEQLEVIKEQKRIETENRRHKMAVKYGPVSHGIFDVREEEIAEVENSWEISTEHVKKKETDEQALIPKKLTMNSACILTTKEKGKREAEREVIGIFMTEEDFVGMDCVSGKITAHESFHCMLELDEPVYFWELFPEEKRLKSWGSRRMKYVSTLLVKKLFDKILSMELVEEVREEIMELYQYYCEVNVI